MTTVNPPKFSESDLAQAVITWLSEQHWEIYQEVEFPGRGGVADIVAVRHNVIWIIECKMSYSFAVLQQASRWPVHYRSVAVPSATSKSGRDARDYLVAKHYYQVGVLEVGSKWGLTSVHESVPAPIFIRHRREAKMYIKTLTELHKTFAKAGSPGGYHLTPYKQSMIEIQKFIEANPGCTLKDLFNGLGELHYYSKASFMGNVIKCLMSFETSWCNVNTDSIPYKLYVKSKPVGESQNPPKS